MPKIDLVRPNLVARYPWVHRTTVWSGTFATDGEGKGQQAELDAAVQVMRQAGFEVVTHEEAF